MGGDRGIERTKKRLACTLVIEGSRLAGIVLDLSANGLFVQTSASPPPGAALGLEVEIPGEAQRSLLAVRVARKKVVPPLLKSVAHAGLGLQIESAPEAYFGYVAQLQPGKAEAASPGVAGKAEAASPGVAGKAKAASPGVAGKAKAASPATAAPPAKAKPASGRGAPPRPPVAAKEQRFRVRVSQIGGSRSRLLEVSAASEQEARCEATAASGEGWKILACERVE